MNPVLKKLKPLLIIALVVGVAGYIASEFLGSGKDARYETATVDRGKIQQSVSANGTLNPVKLVNVGTQISGVVREIHADFNDQVEEGQILAKLDQSLLNAQLQQSEGNLANAEAQLKLANANVARNRALFAKQYVPRADLDKAEQEQQTAEALVKTATGQVEKDKVNISYSIIRSPVAGVIISRAVDVGQTVAASFQTPTLFSIAQDLKQMQIDTSLSEADVGNVKEGMPVRFTVDAFQGRRFEGKVRQIRLNPTTVQNVVTYNVVIDVNNDDLTLLPGMTAFVKLIEAEKEDVLRVPNSALSFRPSEEKKSGETRRQKPEEGHDKPKAVHVLSYGSPKRIEVTTGLTDGKMTEILSGEIKEGDTVVIAENTPKNSSSGGNRGGGGGRTPRLF